MPTIRNLSRLFHAIAGKDLHKAEVIANEIAGAEEKTGHHSAAQLLRGALHPNGSRVHRNVESTMTVIPPESFISSALALIKAETLLPDVVLRPDCRKRLESILAESKYASRLRAKALALANELGLPHYVVRFDAVIGAYLGQTAIHLRQLFQFVSNTPCVLLFDEIDALGTQRGNTRDVGELDRIVIALMQELDLLTTKGIVIAASNLPEHLDRALARRFDLIVRFPVPKKMELLQFSKTLAKRFKISLSERVIVELSRVSSFAEAEKSIEDEARRLALAEFEG